MSFFEEIGVDMQHRSTSIDQAIRRFDRSCELCTLRGRNIKCSNCHIRGAHETVMSILQIDATKA